MVSFADKNFTGDKQNAWAEIQLMVPIFHSRFQVYAVARKLELKAGRINTRGLQPGRGKIVKISWRNYQVPLPHRDRAFVRATVSDLCKLQCVPKCFPILIRITREVFRPGIQFRYFGKLKRVVTQLDDGGGGD